MRRIALTLCLGLVVVFAGAACFLYLERLNFRGNGRLTFVLNPGEEIVFWVSLPPGEYSIASVLGGPNESFASRVDVGGVELVVSQGDIERFNGPLNASTRITVGGYGKGLLKVKIYYSEIETDEVLIILGQPL